MSARCPTRLPSAGPLTGRLLPVALLLLLIGAGCSARPQRWAVVRFERLSYTNLYQQVADAIDGSGYRVIKQDVGTGTIETDWEYGFSVHELRGPSRRKVYARVREVEVERPESPGAFHDPRYEVRVRVAEQVIRKGGTLATHIRESDDWEDYDDDYDQAEHLVAKLGALLSEFRVRVHRADPGDAP